MSGYVVVVPWTVICKLVELTLPAVADIESG